jgi:predicted DNA-binding transcriptional regulator YafY
LKNKPQTRLARLVAILTHLQTKRYLTVNDIEKKFGVSSRTIYRDLSVLEKAGVPIFNERTKGYSIIEGYRLPPIMFSDEETNALITAEQLVLKNRDNSLIKNYSQALNKIKAVLKYTTKDKAELLSKRLSFGRNLKIEITSNFLSVIQSALINFKPLEINYLSVNNIKTTRIIEPLALYSSQENWVLIAWCRLRKQYREFRLDRINKLNLVSESFPHRDFGIKSYFENADKK